MQKQRTSQEMEEAHKQQAEKLEKKDADRLALLKKIAELEQQLDDNEKFGTTPQATIPMARPLRRTETYVEIPSKADKGGNAMEIDESGTEFEEFELDSEKEEATKKDSEDDRRKAKAKPAIPVQRKRKATTKGNGDEI